MKNKKIEKLLVGKSDDTVIRRIGVKLDEITSQVNSLTERVEGMEKAYDDLRVEFFHNLPENIINIEKLAERVDTHSIQINKLAKAIYHLEGSDDLVSAEAIKPVKASDIMGSIPTLNGMDATDIDAGDALREAMKPETINIYEIGRDKAIKARRDAMDTPSPWKPEAGEEYWYVGDDGFFNAESFIWLGNGDSTDRKLYELGNCFKTKKQADAAAERVRKALHPTKEDPEDPFDFVQPCEPDCTPERHAYHQGQWDMAVRMDKAHSYGTYPGAVDDGKVEETE